MEGEREDMGPQAEAEPSSGCVFFDLNITCRKNACPICTSALVERYWPKPWTSTRPDGEEMVEVRDAHGRTILRLEWPFHGDEDASEAEQANYLLADRITALAVRPDNDELVERVARAAYAAHHHCGPTEEAYAEPNWGRGGFKTERLVWDAVARAAIAALREQGRSVRVEDLTEEEVEAIRNAKPREQGEG